MYFDSLQAALAMDGHGVYVWTVVVVSVLVCAGLLVVPARSARRFIADLRVDEVFENKPAPSVRIEEVNNAPGS